MACAPSEGSDRPGHPPSLIRVRVFSVRMKKGWPVLWPTLNTKTMIRLGECTGLSESLLVAHVILLVLSCAGSFANISQIQMTLLFPVNHVYRKLKAFSEKSKVNGVLYF